MPSNGSGLFTVFLYASPNTLKFTVIENILSCGVLKFSVDRPHLQARLPPSFSLLSNLISSHRSLLRSNLISSHRSRLGKNLISSQKRRRLEEKARIEERMKL
ncbi:unnamed protein product [Brassica oleracea]